MVASSGKKQSSDNLNKFKPIIFFILHLNSSIQQISASSFLIINDLANLDRPYFDDISPRNISAVVDETAILRCRVKNKGNRTVSWMRKRDLHILTTNIYTYTGDQRFSVLHPPNSDDWDLKIDYAQTRDSGIYECQVNTEPKINLAITLEITVTEVTAVTVINPLVNKNSFARINQILHCEQSTAKRYSLFCQIVQQDMPKNVFFSRIIAAENDMRDINSEKLYYNSKAARAKILGSTEIHVKRDSTIALACSVNIHASSVLWYHGSAIVDFDSLRGGISLETEKTDAGTTSRLMLTRASLRDSGNYTCVPNAAVPASVRVHVLTGEQPAAMQTSVASVINASTAIIITYLIISEDLLFKISDLAQYILLHRSSR